MPMHCVHGQAPWPVSLGPLRPGRRALSKLCPPSRGTDPSAPAGRPDKAEDPDALQSLADLETTAGRIWNLTMDVAAAATAGDESSEKGQREGDDDASFALQQRLEDLSMLQTSQMQQLMVVRISHSLSLSWQKVVKFARLRQCMFSSCICMKKKKTKQETKQTKQDAVAAVLGRVSSGTIDDQRNFSTQWLQREQRVLDALISIVEESDVTDEELRGLVNDACEHPLQTSLLERC